jgi:hypothetical protein
MKPMIMDVQPIYHVQITLFVESPNQKIMQLLDVYMFLFLVVWKRDLLPGAESHADLNAYITFCLRHCFNLTRLVPYFL